MYCGSSSSSSSSSNSSSSSSVALLDRLSAYGCLSTGLDEGLIEIVTPASTHCQIQQEYPGMTKMHSAFNKLCIYQWLQKHNPSEQRYTASLVLFIIVNSSGNDASLLDYYSAGIYSFFFVTISLSSSGHCHGTFMHGCKCVRFYNPNSKFGGPPQRKFRCQKHAKFDQFWTTYKFDAKYLCCLVSAIALIVVCMISIVVVVM